MYRIFDIAFESELKLPGLAEVSGWPPDWHVILSKSAIDESGYAWFHAWQTPSSKASIPAMTCARKGNSYLLRFTDLADFEIDFAAGEIRCHSPVEDNGETLSRLLQDQVFPRVMSHQGRPVFHASSVLNRDGHAIAFLGETGSGKSTLASAFYRAGCRILSDDALLVERENEGSFLTGTAAYPSLRLWRDSVDGLFPEHHGFSSIPGMPGKQQWFPKQGSGVSSAAVRVLFVLGRSDERQEPGCIQIEPAGGSVAIMSLVESLFALDVRDKALVRQNFTLLGQLAYTETSIYTLNYPKTYSILDEVVERVMSERF